MAAKFFCVLIGLVVSVAAGQSNFTETCHGIELLSDSLSHTSQLKATCSNEMIEGGQSHESTIDLNLCVGIDQTNGQLVWSIYGKYTLYCSNCSLAEPALLSCACKPLTQGDARSTTLDLDDGIGNESGVLSCIGGIGS